MQWFKKFYDSVDNDGNNNSVLKGTPPTLKLEVSPVRPVSPNPLKDMEEEKESLAKAIEALEYEKNYYYDKLQKIERLCEESGENIPKVKLILEKLYEPQLEFQI